MIWISLASTAVTTAVSLSLIILHLRRYRAPKEQRQIVRIVFSVVVYSVVAFFEIYQYSIAQYIDPIGDIYEAFGLW
jgi:membrane-anchored protein YejM (alkaline phosphatase superfamily)